MYAAVKEMYGEQMLSRRPSFIGVSSSHKGLCMTEAEEWETNGDSTETMVNTMSRSLLRFWQI